MAHVVRSHIDLSTLLKDPHPQVDLRISVYETSTRNFLKAVCNYKNRAISVISDRRKHQSADRKRVLDKIQATEAETNQCKVKELKLLADLEREQEERKESELSVATFKRQLSGLREKCSSIEIDNQHCRLSVTNLRREKNKERSILNSLASSTSPELDAYQSKLSCVLEGIERDCLLVRFSCIDEADVHREFSLVIDVSSPSYKVLRSSPPLPTLPILVDELNSSRDVFAFIREVRSVFEGNK